MVGRRHRSPAHTGGGSHVGLAVIRERCAGIDVHKRQVTVHVHIPGRQETREFPADTGSLLATVD